MLNWIRNLFNRIRAEEEIEVPFEPAIEPVEEIPTFDGMSKLDIDIWAKQELGIDLDRRRTREYMIEVIHKYLKKEN